MILAHRQAAHQSGKIWRRCQGGQRQRAAIEAFFRARVLPLGQGAAAPVPTPGAGSDSLYHPRGGERPRPEAMELAFGRRREIARTLDAHWRGTPLLGLGRALLRLARRFPRRAERSEVSSDVYEMF